MVFVLLTAGVAAEQYGHGFLNFLGYFDVGLATLVLTVSVVVGIAKGVADSRAERA